MSVRDRDDREIEHETWKLPNRHGGFMEVNWTDFDIEGFKALVRPNMPWKMRGLYLRRTDETGERCELSANNAWRRNYWKTKKYCVDENIDKRNYAHTPGHCTQKLIYAYKQVRADFQLNALGGLDIDESTNPNGDQ